MRDSTRRRFLRTGGVVGIAGLTGCSQITGGGGVKDTDGDGVIDSEDYAPRDPDVQDAEDVEGDDSNGSDEQTEEDETQAIEPYTKVKSLVVTTESTNRTISKAQPLYLRDGDPSASGNGQIEIDFSRIDNRSDIAVYDQSNSILPYEIEALDTSRGYGILWVKNNWQRDGSVQAKVVYDNSEQMGKENQSETWNGKNQNTAMVQHLNGNVRDSTNNGNNGRLVGSPSMVEGTNPGYRFNGQGDYVQIPDSPSLNPSSEITITCIMNGKTSGGWSHLVSKNNPDTENSYWIGANNSEISFALFDQSATISEGNRNELRSSNISNNTKYYISGTYDGEQQKLFVNDNLEASNPLNVDLNNGEESVSIANSRGNSQFFSGKMYEARIYTEGKRREWIKADYHASLIDGQTFFDQIPAGQ